MYHVRRRAQLRKEAASDEADVAEGYRGVVFHFRDWVEALMREPAAYRQELREKLQKLWDADDHDAARRTSHARPLAWALATSPSSCSPGTAPSISFLGEAVLLMPPGTGRDSALGSLSLMRRGLESAFEALCVQSAAPLDRDDGEPSEADETTDTVEQAVTKFHQQRKDGYPFRKAFATLYATAHGIEDTLHAKWRYDFVTALSTARESVIDKDASEELER